MWFGIATVVALAGLPDTALHGHRGAWPVGAVLELVADQRMAQVKIRLIDARFRFHGLELFSKQANPFELDVFGYPGATVAGWKAAHLDYLSAWFAQRNYQLVVLEFGTNEGNAKPFDLSSYRKTLTESVRNTKTVFPAAACILIARGTAAYWSGARPISGRKTVCLRVDFRK